ncbi:MAG: hypothetical protein U5L98_16560 [Halomonas sp.]|uniref:hypothetical protein n=1 Tax=Halomonas sp. TaxID=1486246 RepID=UPI002ACE8FCD|nr:hypothetical protein [Halomonas sp.]MDZ7854195.1 hypothetical protein [Halomonas sp.]
MSQSTYHHYPSFTRRYVRSVLKYMGLPKKPKVEAELFGEILQDQEVALSINGEISMLEWHHGREGRVVVPEPTLSTWLQTVQLSKVQGDAWDCKYRRRNAPVRSRSRQWLRRVSAGRKRAASH